MKRTGLVVFFLSAILFFVDRFTHVLTGFLRRMICKSTYLQPVEGIVGDKSCGFNLDMYLAAGLLILLFVGGVLFFLSSIKD